MYQRDYSYSPMRKSNTFHPSSTYHTSRNYDRPSDNYHVSSYLVRKGPKKVEEPTKDYNFEEYFCGVLSPTLYSRYYNSHKILNQGKRFYPNLRLQLNRFNGGYTNASSNCSSLISTPSSVQCSRSPSPIHRSSRPTSPHFDYDYNSELVDGIQLSRAKSPLLSRPLSPIQLSNPLNLSSNPLALNKTRSKSASSHTVYSSPSIKKQDHKFDESNKSELTVNEFNSKLNETNALENSSKRKTKSDHALNDSKRNNDFEKINEENQLNKVEEKSLDLRPKNEKSNNDLDSLSGDQNLIKILSQNIIELTENLNLLFKNEKNSNELSQTKSSESKDNDLIEKIDQLRQVSQKLQETTQQNQNDHKSQSITKSINQQTTEQLNLVDQVDSLNNLQTNQIEFEYAECRSIDDKSNNLDKVQIHQQLIIQNLDENENGQFNEQNQDKKLKQINKSIEKDKIEIKDQKVQKIESQEDDEFFECSNEEQKDLRKSMFKGSKLNLESLIDKAIDEQLLGQWLKLSDSIDSSEDGPIEQKHSLEDLKHKFATKLAIIHYKLYQKYSKNSPINNKIKKYGGHRKLNKYNKLQSKYTLLQGIMDDDQFIEFLMDKIKYFMRKIRLCKSQRKELKKGLSKLDLNQSTELLNKDKQDEGDENSLKQKQFEFDKIGLNDDLIELKSKDENNNLSIDEQDKIKAIVDENNNDEQIREETNLNQSISIDKLNESIINDLNDFDLKNLKDLKDLDIDINKELESINENLDNDNENEIKNNKRKPLSIYTILFIITLIIFMILIVLFRSWINWIPVNEIKKCTNCVRNLDSNQLILKPANQFKQQQASYPACDHRIILEAQRLLNGNYLLRRN